MGFRKKNSALSETPVVGALAEKKTLQFQVSFQLKESQITTKLLCLFISDTACRSVTQGFLSPMLFFASRET